MEICCHGQFSYPKASNVANSAHPIRFKNGSFLNMEANNTVELIFVKLLKMLRNRIPLGNCLSGLGEIPPLPCDVSL